MCSIDDGRLSNKTCTWPPIKSVSAGAAPLIGHVLHFTPVIAMNNSPGEMHRCAIARRCHVDLAGIGFGVCDKFGDRLCRNIRIDFHHVGNADEAGNRFKIAQEYEIKMLVKRGVDCVCWVRQQNGVAVGRGLDDKLGRKIVAGTGAVFHNELLAKPFAEILTENPREDVGRTARWIADVNVRRTGWVIDSGGVPTT